MTDEMGALLLQAAAAPLGMDFFFMIGSIGLIFYLLVLRPDSAKRKEHEAQIAAAGKGDEVTTTGGIQGLITGSTDDVVTIEIAVLKSGERVRVKVARTAIASIGKVGSDATDKDKKKGGEA
jgi:preprotein translocase subunit YajC